MCAGLRRVFRVCSAGPLDLENMLINCRSHNRWRRVLFLPKRYFGILLKPILILDFEEAFWRERSRQYRLLADTELRFFSFSQRPPSSAYFPSCAILGVENLSL